MPADSGMTAGVITGDLLICKCMMVRVGLLVKAGYWGQGTPNMVVALARTVSTHVWYETRHHQPCSASLAMGEKFVTFSL